MADEQNIRKMWSSNAFMNVLGVQIKEIKPGGVILQMPICADVHTNHWLGVHGGALAALADCATGILCASAGKAAQTLSMQINYIGSLRLDGTAVLYGKIKHQGTSTIVIQSEIYDDNNVLICCASNTMFIMGEL